MENPMSTNNKMDESPEQKVSNREHLKKDPDPNIWSNWQGSVLLRDEIKRYCMPPINLITPFDENKYLKPASYHLRLGSKCRVDGKDIELSEDKPRLTILPHGIAVVSTLERLNIPGFLIARWNLKVKRVYEGLVWVGGAQVDPGYSGNLFCPLYNLSNEPVHLDLGNTLFTIDFVRTTVYDESKGCSLIELDRPTDSLGALDKIPLKSAPKEQFDEMKKQLNEMQASLQNFQSRIDSFQGITFAVLGIIIAALSFVSVSQFTDMRTRNPSEWQIATWIIVLVAILTLTGILAYAVLNILKRK
jgi:deoxycytidine triphosphate deaminase